MIQSYPALLPLVELTGLVHGELHLMARRSMRNERPGNTLQATALINEVYLRLVDLKAVEWQHRAQFFAISARMMRNILVDAARARGVLKRGGDAAKVNADDVRLESPRPDLFILALDEALTAFAQVAPRQAKVVELRYFGGMGEVETAAKRLHYSSSPASWRSMWRAEARLLRMRSWREMNHAG